MKNIIEKSDLALALFLAVVVGPAISSAGSANQQAAGVKGIESATGVNYAVLDPLNRDQLISVIKCLTNGSGAGLPKCVARMTQAPATSTPATLTVSNPAVQLRASNYRISTIDGAKAVPMINFNAKSDTNTSVITSIQANYGGSKPTTLYLYDGATLLKSKSVGGTEGVTFDNLSLSIPKDMTKTLTVKADFGSNTLPDTISNAYVTSVTYNRGNGTSATVTSGVSGPTHHFYLAIADIKLAGTPTILATQNASGTTAFLTATFPLSITVRGGNMQMLATDGRDTLVAFTNGTSNYAPSSRSVVTIPNQAIADGSTASVTVTASADRNKLLSSGIYSAFMQRIDWNVGGTRAYQTWGLEDFKTPSAAQFNR